MTVEVDGFRPLSGKWIESNGSNGVRRGSASHGFRPLSGKWIERIL